MTSSEQLLRSLGLDPDLYLRRPGPLTAVQVEQMRLLARRFGLRTFDDSEARKLLRETCGLNHCALAPLWFSTRALLPLGGSNSRINPCHPICDMLREEGLLTGEE